MSKKRQELELELRKLDIDRRDVDVRIRSIEESPRNQRILAGDFSRPPPREGDTRRIRGRGIGSDRAEAKEEAEKEKEEKAEDAANEESTPSVSSAVVVESETKEEEGKPARGKRKLGGGANEERNRRIFSSLLMGNLNKAQKRNKEDRDDVNLKKKEELEAKVREKLTQRTVGMLEKEAEQLAKQRDQEKKLREEIMRKEETKRRELDELIAIEHEELLGNFIRTETEPFVYYLPASHTEKTRKLLQKTKEMHDARVAEGKVVLEKELDEEFILELFKPKVVEKEGEGEEAGKEGETEKEKDKKDADGGEKEKEKEKGAEKGKDKESSSKKSRKKKAESSSSSSSSSSDSSSDSD